MTGGLWPDVRGAASSLRRGRAGGPGPRTVGHADAGRPDRLPLPQMVRRPAPRTLRRRRVAAPDPTVPSTCAGTRTSRRCTTAHARWPRPKPVTPVRCSRAKPCRASSSPSRRRCARSAIHLAVLRRLVEGHAGAGNTDEALRHGLRLLRVDPYDEPTHLVLVGRLAAARRHGEALRHYRLYTARMRDLGIEPAGFPGPASPPSPSSASRTCRG